MNEIKLSIIGLSYSQSQSGAYALILGEEEGNRRLPIIIGSAEAQAIAVEIENINPERPLTHDLFKSSFDQFDIKLEKILIYNLEDGIFFAHLICSQDGENIKIDARTSDAVALAVRFGCSIYTYESIMSAAGIAIESNDFAFLDNLESDLKKEEIPESKSTAGDKAVNPFATLSAKKLEQSLQKAIESEQYELAAKLRDELKKRQG